MTNLWFPKSLFPKTINEQENKLNQNLKKTKKHDFRSIQAVKENRNQKKKYRKSTYLTQKLGN